jgi:hypothetical protein
MTVRERERWQRRWENRREQRWKYAWETRLKKSECRSDNSGERAEVIEKAE